MRDRSPSSSHRSTRPTILTNQAVRLNVSVPTRTPPVCYQRHWPHQARCANENRVPRHSPRARPSHAVAGRKQKLILAHCRQQTPFASVAGAFGGRLFIVELKVFVKVSNESNEFIINTFCGHVEVSKIKNHCLRRTENFLRMSNRIAVNGSCCTETTRRSNQFNSSVSIYELCRSRTLSIRQSLTRHQKITLPSYI